MKRTFRGRPVRAVSARAAFVWACLLAVPTIAHTQSLPAQQEQRQRSQQQARQREALRDAPDVRLPQGAAGDYSQTTLPTEKPCFVLSAISLEGAHAAQFGFIRRYLEKYRERCAGQQGLALLAHRASDLLIARGFVTSRLVIPPQNLRQGQLRVVLIAGTLGRVRLAPGSRAVDWRSAIPLRPGDVINLRAIEQGLEQLKRVPSQDVKIDIAPGQLAGTSDLVLTAVRSKPWRVTLNMDDAGSNATGKEQGGVTLALDQPLGINDLLSVGVSNTVGGYRGEKGTRGNHMSYSLPRGNWTFSLDASKYGYRQPVTGSLQTFSFTGTSQSTSFSATRLLQRDARGKTSVELDVGVRDAQSYVDGVEIATQRRLTSSAEVALVHRRYLGHAQLDARLAYRRGTPWFGAQWEGAFDGGPTHRYGLTTLDASLSLPFQLGSRALFWLSELHVQATGDHLYVEDDLAIGNRYSVRGFDGNATLGGERGAYWRNTLNLPLADGATSIYGGLDTGRVDGNTAPGLSSHQLSGAVVGCRGARWGLSWDLFMGWALQTPRGFQTRRPTAGMQWIFTL